MNLDELKKRLIEGVRAKMPSPNGWHGPSNHAWEEGKKECIDDVLSVVESVFAEIGEGYDYGRAVRLEDFDPDERQSYWLETPTGTQIPVTGRQLIDQRDALPIVYEVYPNPIPRPKGGEGK